MVKHLKRPRWAWVRGVLRGSLAMFLTQRPPPCGYDPREIPRQAAGASCATQPLALKMEEGVIYPRLLLRAGVLCSTLPLDFPFRRRPFAIETEDHRGRGPRSRSRLSLICTSVYADVACRKRRRRSEQVTLKHPRLRHQQSSRHLKKRKQHRFPGRLTMLMKWTELRPQISSAVTKSLYCRSC